MIKRFLSRVLLFITYNPHMVIYCLLTILETFIFIFKVLKKHPSDVYKDFMMKKFFSKLYKQCVIPEVEKMFRNPLNKSRFRNDICLCGSSKKMKKCHGKKYEVTNKELSEIVVMYNERFGKNVGGLRLADNKKASKEV